MVVSEDTTYGKKNIDTYIKELQSRFIFDDDTFESKIALVYSLLIEETGLRKEVKNESEKLHLKTKTTIENLSESQVYEMLELKWIYPLVESLNKLPYGIIDNLTKKIQFLAQKYETTLVDVENEINKTQKELSFMMDELDGDEFDMKGLKAFQELLRG